VDRTLERFGQIDVLANIAGWGRYEWLDEMTADDLRQQYEVNVLGLAELTRQVLPSMIARRSGVILNMSSYASKIAVPPQTVYASTKSAVEGLSDGLRRELAPWGVRVVRIHPSGVKDTEFNKKAGQGGGIRFKAPAVGRVSREHLARALVRLVEHPRPSLFLSRLYDVPVLINRLAPWLVDWVMGLWVRQKRKTLAQSSPAPAVARGWQRVAGAVGALVLGALVVGLLAKKQS
jgi:short-subunit dehydrogenase